MTLNMSEKHPVTKKSPSIGGVGSGKGFTHPELPVFTTPPPADAQYTRHDAPRVTPRAIRLLIVPERAHDATPDDRQEAAFAERLTVASATGRVELSVSARDGVVVPTVTAWGCDPAAWLPLLPDGYHAESGPAPQFRGETARLVRRLGVIDRPNGDRPNARLARAHARRAADTTRRRAMAVATPNPEVIGCAPAVWPLGRPADGTPGRWLNLLVSLGEAAVVVTICPVPDADRASAADTHAALAEDTNRRPETAPPSDRAARLLSGTSARLARPTADLRAVAVTAYAPTEADARTLLRAWAADHSAPGAFADTSDVGWPWESDDPPLADQLRKMQSALRLDDPTGVGAADVRRLSRLLEVTYTVTECGRLLRLPTGPARGLRSAAVSPFPPTAGGGTPAGGPVVSFGYVATPRLLPMSGPEATPDNPRLKGVEELTVPVQSLYGHLAATGGVGKGKGHWLGSVLRQLAPFLKVTIVDTAVAEHFDIQRHNFPDLRRLRTIYEGPPAGRPDALVFDFARIPHGVPMQMHLSLLMPGLAALFNSHASLTSYLERGVRWYYQRACGLRNSTRGRPSLLKYDAAGYPMPGFQSLCHYFLNEYIPATVGSLGGGREAEYRNYFETRWENLRDGPLGEVCREADALLIAKTGGGPLNDADPTHQFWYDLFTEVREWSSVIELETLPGEEERAAVMMFLLSFFQMHLWVRYKRDGKQRPLERLLVLEEAHLIAGPAGGGGRAELAGDSPQARTLKLLLTTLRAFRKYGVGVVLLTPAAAGLAPDVMDEVESHVAFRASGRRSRRLLADTLQCTPEEADFLGRLDRGNAVVRVPTHPRPVPIIVPNNRPAG